MSAVVLERDSELEELDGLLGEAGRGHGRLVLVRGEAGIGKTTLVQAFAAGRESRVHWGACDPVVPPRPFAPIVDIASAAGGALQDALAEGDQHGVIAGFLALLRAEGGPRVAVLEDVHWADEGTLELLGAVGRRMAQLPALVLATFRDDELDPSHPLLAAMGDIPRSAMTTLSLPPLSVGAVEQLAAGTALDPSRLHAASGGNPFFVTEVIESGTTSLPASVRDAVWARARRLPPAALAVARAAAVLGQRSEVDVACSVAEAQAADLQDCVARGMLRSDGATVEFRHELVRRAVLESVTPAERAALERRALRVLVARPLPVDLSRAAHHAEAAGDAEAVLEWAPRAGARASSLGAHREARAHYASALRFADRLAVDERAQLLEAHAWECYVGDDPDDAIANQQAAIAGWQHLGDAAAEGKALSTLSVFCSRGRHNPEAAEAATKAVALLEPLGPDVALAWAYARLAQVNMVIGQPALGIEFGERAISLARQLGENEVVVHALNTVGVCEYQLGREHGWPKVEESLRLALASGLEDGIARAFNNLVALSREEHRYDLLDGYLAETMAFMAEHDLDATQRCLVGDVAEAFLDRGRWDEAETYSRDILERNQPSGRMQTFRALGRLAARRGDADPWPLLDEGLALARTWNAEDEINTLLARAEAAWLAGDQRTAAAEIEVALARAQSPISPWVAGELVYRATQLGLPVEETEGTARVAEPWALHLAGHPSKAATAWRALGCPYDEARALADTDDEAEVRRALELFQSLGAAPAAALASEKLRSMGARGIARGPRKSTRANPSALTDRELDVLALLGEGLRNAEIAERLVVSAKTVDHHVSSILGKLGVRDRYAAGQEAIRLGLTAPSG